MVSFGGLARKLLGSSNSRRVRKFEPTVKAINALEDELSRLSDAELRARTDAFRAEINDLRHRLGIPLLPQPDPGALGLVVPQDGWDMDKERKQE